MDTSAVAIPPNLSSPEAQAYSRLLLAAKSFVFRLSPRGHLELLMPPAERVMGWATEEVRARPFTHILVPQHRDRAWAAFLSAQAGVEQRLQTDVAAPSGKIRHVDFVLVPGSDGTVFGIGNDATKAVAASRQRAQHRNALIAIATSEPFRRGRIDHALDHLTARAAEAMGVSRASVWKLDDNGQRLKCLSLFDTTKGGHESGAEIRARDFPVYFAALSADRCVAAHDATRDPRTRELADSYLKPLGVSALLDAPIQQGGTLLGVVCHEHRGARREWTPEEESFAGSLGDLAALLFERRSRRSAERALARAEENYESLVSSVRAIVWRGEARTLRTHFVSTTAKALLGYETARWTKEVNFLIDRIHPEDRDFVLDIARSAERENRDFDLEMRVLTASDRILWMRGSFRLVGRSGAKRQAVGLLQDVTARRQAEEEAREREAALRDFSGHVEWAREEERKRLSRVIHDQLGQTLTAMRLDAAALRTNLSAKVVNRDAALDRSKAVIEMIDATLAQARTLARDLRPSILDDLGLLAAIEWQVDQFKKSSRLPCRIALDKPVHVSRDVATALFRILQESLTNIARHAQAKKIEISLKRREKTVELQIKDDGRGFSPSAKSSGSFGLVGMQERARRVGGSCLVTGRKGRGVTVLATAPTEPAPA